MNKIDGQKVVDFIEGYYHKKLEVNEIKALSEELKDFDFGFFENNFKKILLKRFEYFSVANLHSVIEDYKKSENLKKQLGIKSFEELYEN